MLAITGCNTTYFVQPIGESLTKLNAQDGYNYKSTSISVIGSKQPYLGLSNPTTMESMSTHFWPLDFIKLRMKKVLEPVSDSYAEPICQVKLRITSVDYRNHSGSSKGSYYVMVGFNAELSIYSSDNQKLLQQELTSDKLRGRIVPMSWEFRPSVLGEEFRMELVNVSTRAAKALVDKVLQTIDSVEQCQ
jgi:hypothetical protein